MSYHYVCFVTVLYTGFVSHFSQTVMIASIVPFLYGKTRQSYQYIVFSVYKMIEGH